MARKRLSRKELVQKDEITTTLETMTAFLLEHGKLLATGAGVVVAVVLVFVAWSVYAANREASSQSALAKVIAAFADTEGFDSDQQRFETALAQGQVVRDDYPNLRAGQIAEYYMALSHEGLGNTTESVRILRGLIETGDETIQQVARYALAESYKTHGELETAIAVFQELVDTAGYSQGAVLYELGRLHEAISKPEEARSYYRSIVGEYPDSPFRPDADRALERLGTEETPSEETES